MRRVSGLLVVHFICLPLIRLQEMLRRTFDPTSAKCAG
ncbi:hypothetical protein AGROH133_12152 [Agrobacterium tumefaciens]|nr:hypothetical protein AGROH133_12152 [Agrobacterium tumefaciens]